MLRFGEELTADYKQSIGTILVFFVYGLWPGLFSVTDRVTRHNRETRAGSLVAGAVLNLRPV